MKKKKQKLWEIILGLILIVVFTIGAIYTVRLIIIPAIEFPFKVYDNYKEMQFQLGMEYLEVCFLGDCYRQKSLESRVRALEKLYNK